MSRPLADLINKICPNCSKNFYYKCYDREKTCCSYNCNVEYYRKTKSYPKSLLVKFKCKNCGKDFERKKYYVKSKKKQGINIKYCSVKCRKESHVGKTHPAWKGGFTKSNPYGLEWPKQRRLALKRDNNECQICMSVDMIEVHHWEPFRFSRNNALDNLITLCKDCHLRMHFNYKKEGLIKDFEKAEI